MQSCRQERASKDATELVNILPRRFGHSLLLPNTTTPPMPDLDEADIDAQIAQLEAIRQARRAKAEAAARERDREAAKVLVQNTPTKAKRTCPAELADTSRSRRPTRRSKPAQVHCIRTTRRAAASQARGAPSPPVERQLRCGARSAARRRRAGPG